MYKGHRIKSLERVTKFIDNSINHGNLRIDLFYFLELMIERDYLKYFMYELRARRERERMEAVPNYNLMNQKISHREWECIHCGKDAQKCMCNRTSQELRINEENQ